MRVKIIDDEYEDILTIDIQKYHNVFEYSISTPTEYNIREGSIYNHDPEDILGLISKISTVNGKI